jgi:hypothetical protein
MPPTARALCAANIDKTFDEIVKICQDVYKMDPETFSQGNYGRVANIIQQSSPTISDVMKQMNDNDSSMQIFLSKMNENMNIQGNRVNVLEEKLGGLERSVAELCKIRPNENRANLPQYSSPGERIENNPYVQNRPQSKSSFNPNGRLCYAHYTLGKNATSCTQPCSWIDYRRAPPSNYAQSAPQINSGPQQLSYRQYAPRPPSPHYAPQPPSPQFQSPQTPQDVNDGRRRWGENPTLHDVSKNE